MEKASLPGDSTPQVPLVRYGRFVKHIPGDKYGKKTPHSGNVFHFDDPVRVQNFPTFTEADFALQDDGAEDRINTLKALLQQVGPLLEKGQLMALDQLSDTAIIRDNEEEEVIDFDYKSFACRVAHLKDVQYRDRHSYYRSSRARRVEANSVKKIDAIESSMDRAVENFLVAQTISQGKAPRIPQFRATAKRPNGGDNTQKWYKQMRVEATRSFWLDHEKAERDNIRRAALTPADDIRDIITSVEREDNSRSQDPFYQHHKDTAAASDSDTYELIEKDIFIVLDSGFNYILCSVSQTFQKVFGEAKLDKVTDAIRTWVDMAPLPQPETARHMVDVLMRRKHPDLDMEKATTSDELRARAMCVAHYGTWAMKGHTNPALVFLTDDTLLRMHPSAKARVNLTGEVFPQFKKGVLGLTSDVARVVLQSIAPAEYQECQEAFKALQPTKRMAVSRPNWATLFVLGFNPFTQRHRDTNDVKFGLVSLVPFGDYKGKPSPPGHHGTPDEEDVRTCQLTD
ncbi:hypothetical protein GGR56DRAFT_499904 [Xylariaceae sp. FL0804]|nr:hypothetical protein GGR56DRAFT_499904 [Xylariaceae sp. FL0804]